MFSSALPLQGATTSASQLQRGPPEYDQGAGPARDNGPTRSSLREAAPAPLRHGGLSVPFVVDVVAPTMNERQQSSPPQRQISTFSSRQASSAALRASQADKASLARPVLSLETAQPQPSLLDAYMARAEHVSDDLTPVSPQDGSADHGQNAPPQQCVRRRSLRRPPPLQGLRTRSFEGSIAPRTPYSPDMRALHRAPDSHLLTPTEASSGPRRTAVGTASDRSPKRPGSPSPEGDARRRSRARPTAEERAASGHIPRPPNSFMLYRSAQNKLLSQVRSEEGDKLQQADLSRMIAQMWQDETPDVREHYAKQAAAEKAEHALRYPGYTYRPKSSGRRKAIKFKSNSVSPKGRSSQLAAAPPPPTSSAAGAMSSVLTSPAPKVLQAMPLSPFWPLSPARSASYVGSTTSDEDAAAASSCGASTAWPNLRSVPPTGIDPILTQAPFEFEAHVAAGLPASAPTGSDLPWQGPSFGLPFSAQGVLPSQFHPPPTPLPDLPWSSLPNASAFYPPPVDYTPYVNAGVHVGDSASASRERPLYNNALQVSGLLGFDGACTTLDPSFITR